MSDDGRRNAEQMRIAAEKAVEHEINPQIVVSVLGFAPFDSVDTLSSLLLEKNLVDKQRAWVGWLITIMVERCEAQQLPPPASLTQLIRAYTGADRFAANEFRAPGAYEHAGWILAIDHKASQATLARDCGVSRETVRKWVDESGLKKFAGFIRTQLWDFDPDFLREFVEKVRKSFADSPKPSTKISCD